VRQFSSYYDFIISASQDVLRDRLMVGQEPLKLLILVRFQAPQQIILYLCYHIYMKNKTILNAIGWIWIIISIPIPLSGIPAMNIMYSLNLFGDYKSGGISLLLPTLVLMIISILLSLLLFIYNKKEPLNTSRLRLVNILSIIALVLYVYIGILQIISFASGRL
jgi:hypothetical protein